MQRQPCWTKHANQRSTLSLINLWYRTHQLFYQHTIGVNTRGGRVPPPRNHSARDANVIRPPDFDHLRREKRQNLVPKYTKIQFFSGLCPEPRWGSLQRSLKPLAAGEGACCPLPKNPTPHSQPSGPRASAQGPKLRSSPSNFSPDLRLWPWFAIFREANFRVRVKIFTENSEYRSMFIIFHEFHGK